MYKIIFQKCSTFYVLHLSHPPCHCVTCSGLDISSLPRPAESGWGDIPHTRHNSRQHRGGKNMFIVDMEAMFDAGLISTDKFDKSCSSSFRTFASCTVSSFRLSLPSTSNEWVSRGGGRSLTEAQQKLPANQGLKQPVRNVKATLSHISYNLHVCSLLHWRIDYSIIKQLSTEMIFKKPDYSR